MFDKQPRQLLDLATPLRIAKSYRRLSVADLATMAGVSKSAMEVWLRGPCAPYCDAVVRLADALDVLTDDILMFDPRDQDAIARLMHGARAGIEIGGK